jgi:hypothetical protein
MGTVSSNIIFQMGVLGSAATIGKFAAVGAAVFAATAKLNDLQKSGEQYRRLQANLAIDMGQFNKETHGLIDTMASLEGAMKLQQSGAKVSAKAFAALGKAAVAHNQKLGGGPEGATTIFNQLVKNIQKGSDRTFKELGKKLDSTSDLIKSQTELLKFLEEGYSDVNVEVGTTREELFALENNLGTLTDQIFAWGLTTDASAGILNSWNETLSSATTLIDDTQGAIFELDNAFGVVAISIANAAEEMKGLLQALGLYDQKAIDKLKVFGAGKVLQAKATGTERKAAAAARAETTTRHLGRRSKGKGPEEMAFTLEDIQRAEDLETGAYLLERPETDRGFTMDIEAEGFGALAALEQAEKEIALASMTKDQILQLEIQKQLEMEMLQEQEIEHREELYQAELERLGLHYGEWSLIEKEAIDQSRANWDAGLQSKLGMMSGFFRQLSVLQMSESKAAFKIGKAAALSENAINTVLSATKAYQAMAGIPIVGPGLGIAAAVAASAAGIINAKKIASQKFGSAGATEGGMRGAAGGGLGGASGIPSSGYRDQQPVGGGSTTIVLELDGQPIHEAVVNANNNAVQQGLPGFGGVNQ